MSKQKEKLNIDQRHSISHVFENLLSEELSERSYRKYSLPEMKDVVKSKVNENLRKIISPDVSVSKRVTSALTRIQKASSREQVLMLVSEMVLIDEVLTD